MSWANVMLSLLLEIKSSRLISRLADYKNIREGYMSTVKATITMDDLDKIDIRVGTVLSVEDIVKSDKMVKLTVDFGAFKRTILVGMKKERANPAEIIGEQALFIVNLAPRKMFGEVSEGMLFDIGYADGIVPVLAQPEKAVPNGTRVG